MEKEEEKKNPSGSFSLMHTHQPSPDWIHSSGASPQVRAQVLPPEGELTLSAAVSSVGLAVLLLLTPTSTVWSNHAAQRPLGFCV